MVSIPRSEFAPFRPGAPRWNVDGGYSFNSSVGIRPVQTQFGGKPIPLRDCSFNSSVGIRPVQTSARRRPPSATYATFQFLGRNSPRSDLGAWLDSHAAHH